MKRRAKEEEKPKKEEDPNALLKDGFAISNNDSGNYHVELNNKVILIKRPQVDHLQVGFTPKTAVNDGAVSPAVLDPKNQTKRSKLSTTTMFHDIPANQEEYAINLIKGLKKISKNDPFNQYLINKEVKLKPYVALTDEQGTTVTGEMSVEETQAKMR